MGIQWLNMVVQLQTSFVYRFSIQRKPKTIITTPRIGIPNKKNGPKPLYGLLLKETHMFLEEIRQLIKQLMVGNSNSNLSDFNLDCFLQRIEIILNML